MSAEKVRMLEALLERVTSRAAEPRVRSTSLGERLSAASPSHLVVVDDEEADGLEINLVDDLPSSTALPVADVHDPAMFDDLMNESASRLIVSDSAPPLDVELPPRHTPPPESGPLPTPIVDEHEPVDPFDADIELEEPTSLRSRDVEPEVQHVEAKLGALAPKVEVRGALKTTRFVDALVATLKLKP